MNTIERESISKKNIISGGFFLLVGLFVIYMSLRMSIWRHSDAQEGFVPLILGTLMCALSIGLLSANLSKSRIVENVKDPGAADAKGDLLDVLKSRVIEDVEDTGGRDGKIVLRRVYEYLIASFFYVISLEKLGYILTTALFFMAILKFVEKKGYLYSFLITMAAAFGSFFLFDTLLGVPLPLGFFK